MNVCTAVGAIDSKKKYTIKVMCRVIAVANQKGGVGYEK